MFIFQSSLNDINVQQLRMNCPYPLLNKNVTDIEIRGTNIFYNTTEYANTQSASILTVFRCGEGGLMQVNEAVYTFSSGIFDAQQAYLGYLSASMSAFFDKVVAMGNMVYLLINAPAIVTGLAWFSYIIIVLFAFMAIGAFMVIRG